MIFPRDTLMHPRNYEAIVELRDELAAAQVLKIESMLVNTICLREARAVDEVELLSGVTFEDNRTAHVRRWKWHDAYVMQCVIDNGDIRLQLLFGRPDPEF